MVRTQIQLPDELYQRAKTFAADREISLAEVTRRGIELFLSRFPQPTAERPAWTMPRINAGGIKVPLDQLKPLANEEESNRSKRRR